MNKIKIAVLIGAFSPLICWANPIADSLIIELGDNTKLIIYAESKEDLMDLDRFDLNQLINDVNKSISEAQEVKRIKWEDLKGGKYLKDTVVLYETGEDIKIRLGNIKIELDGLKKGKEFDEQWDVIADEWEEQWENVDFNRYTYKEERDKKTINNFNIDLGINGWTKGILNNLSSQNQYYVLKPWGSWYVGFNTINKSQIVGPLFLEWGAGISWYNWKLQDPSYQVVQGAAEVGFVMPTNINDIDPIKSKLVANYLNISMVPLIDFSKGQRNVNVNEKGSLKVYRSREEGIRIGIGGYLGYRLYGRSKFVYKEGGSRNKDKNNNNFYLNNVRYGVRAQFGWRGIDLFFNYDLNNVFSTGNGPDLHGYSFGITL